MTDTLRLGEIWDTVGWIYFRKADYEKALPYIRAAWLLTQDPIVGSHLGQIYEIWARRPKPHTSTNWRLPRPLIAIVKTRMIYANTISNSLGRKPRTTPGFSVVDPARANTTHLRTN